MKVLTVRQPWAWLILHGGKDVENRTRNIAGNYRGPIAIHAGLQIDRDARLPLRWALDIPTEPNLVRGAIIGTVNLWAVHQDHDNGNCCLRPGDGPNGSPWPDPHTWHLCLNNPTALAEPIPYRGSLGLRQLPDDITDRITRRTP